MVEQLKQQLQTIKDNVPKVYDSGHEAGRSAGYNVGYNDGNVVGIEEGAHGEYIRFWSNYSTSLDHIELFAGKMWNDTTFKPPKGTTIAPKGYVRAMFDRCGVTDLAKIVEEQEINLDFSGITSASGIWGESSLTHCPEIDLSNATMIANLFYICSNLHTVDKLIISEKCTKYSSCFTSCKKLVDITFEGAIVVSLDLSACSLLSAKSAKNIIFSLRDLWVTNEQFTQSIKLHEDVWARLDIEYPLGDGLTWKDNFIVTAGWNT